LLDLKDYISSALNKYANFLSYSKHLNSYKLFNEELRKNSTIFTSYYNELTKLHPYKLSIHKLTELGQLMKCFYSLNKEIKLIKIDRLFFNKESLELIYFLKKFKKISKSHDLVNFIYNYKFRFIDNKSLDNDKGDCTVKLFCFAAKPVDIILVTVVPK
jgi:hypothetical protein